MPSPKTKIPADLWPELAQRRSQQQQTLGQITRFLARHNIIVSESALSWQFLRMNIDLAPSRRRPFKVKPGTTEMRNGHIVRRYSPEEDAIIRSLPGAKQSAIARAIKEQLGIERTPHSVLGRMMTLARHDEREAGE